MPPSPNRFGLLGVASKPDDNIGAGAHRRRLKEGGPTRELLHFDSSRPSRSWRFTWRAMTHPPPRLDPRCRHGGVLAADGRRRRGDARAVAGAPARDTRAEDLIGEPSTSLLWAVPRRRQDHSRGGAAALPRQTFGGLYSVVVASSAVALTSADRQSPSSQGKTVPAPSPDDAIHAAPARLSDLSRHMRPSFLSGCKHRLDLLSLALNGWRTASILPLDPSPWRSITVPFAFSTSRSPVGATPARVVSMGLLVGLRVSEWHARPSTARSSAQWPAATGPLQWPTLRVVDRARRSRPA